MSTMAAAIQSYLGSFGIPAYPVSSVPDEAEMPYITYALVTGAWGDGQHNIEANVWYRTESEAEPNAKVAEISKAVSIGGQVIGCDGGAVWIMRGSPWSQTVQDDDTSIKRRMLNFTIEFMTAY